MMDNEEIREMEDMLEKGDNFRKSQVYYTIKKDVYEDVGMNDCAKLCEEMVDCLEELRLIKEKQKNRANKLEDRVDELESWKVKDLDEQKQIQDITKKVECEIPKGVNIRSGIEKVKKVARHLDCTVDFEFNGKKLSVDSNSSIDEKVVEYSGDKDES